MKVCPKCHVSWGDDVKFCSACGEPLPDVTPVQENPAPAEPVNAAPAEPQNPTPSAEPVNPAPAAEPQNPAPQAPAYQQVPPAAQPQNPAYQQTPPVYPGPQGYYQQPKCEEDVGLGKWVLYQLIPYIPGVGSLIYLVMLFVWGFGSDKNATFRNWAKSQLIITAIAVVLTIVIFVLIIALTAGAFSALEGGMSSSDYVW